MVGVGRPNKPLYISSALVLCCLISWLPASSVGPSSATAASLPALSFFFFASCPSVRPSVSLLSSLLSLLFCDSDRSDRMDGRGRSGAFKGLLGQERENQLHKYLHGNDFIFEIKPRTPTFFLGLIPWCGYLVHFRVLIAHSKYVCAHMCLPYCLSAVLQFFCPTKIDDGTPDSRRREYRLRIKNNIWPK